MDDDIATTNPSADQQLTEYPIPPRDPYLGDERGFTQKLPEVRKVWELRGVPRGEPPSWA